jgi:hypothetical protein
MDDHDDLRQLFGPVTPLEPPPGTFERITSTARRRRRVRTFTSVASATTAVAVLCVGGVIAQQRIAGSGGHRPAVNAAASGTDTRTANATPHQDTTITPPGGAPTNGPIGSASPGESTTATCTASQLRVSLGSGQSAGNNVIGLVIVFQNTSSSSCALVDYPGVDLVGSGTKVSAVRLGFQLWTNPLPNQPVTLAPGGYASAGLEAPDGSVASASTCATYSSAEVTPPNLRQSTQLDLGTTITVCPSAAVRITRVTAGDAGPPVR